MAQVNATIVKIGNHTVTFTWALTSTNVNGKPVGENWSDYADRTVHVTGTFGTGTAVFQGSNDGTNFVTMDDVFGNALSGTAEYLKPVAAVPLHSQPAVTGADGSTALTVICVCRRNRGGKEV